MFGILYMKIPRVLPQIDNLPCVAVSGKTFANPMYNNGGVKAGVVNAIPLPGPLINDPPVGT